MQNGSKTSDMLVFIKSENEFDSNCFVEIIHNLWDIFFGAYMISISDVSTFEIVQFDFKNWHGINWQWFHYLKELKID